MLDSRASFLNHIELWLSGAGVLLVFAVPLSLGVENPAFWQVTALVAISVGIIHGLIFWTVRRRQRSVRRRSIAEIREMLADVVKNHLTAIDLYLPAENEAMVRQEIEGIRASIRHITEEVDSLSEESIHDWKRKYDGAIRRTTSLPPASGDASIRPRASASAEPNPSGLATDATSDANPSKRAA